MSRVNEEFGKAVQEKLQKRGWSHQRAWINTTIPGATIGRMALGLVPGEDHIIKWAKALGENINYWLQLAGYDPIPEELICERGTIPTETQQAIERAPTKEDKIKIAFAFVRADKTIRFGASDMGKYPIQAKLDMVRMYERYRNIELLPPDII